MDGCLDRVIHASIGQQGAHGRNECAQHLGLLPGQSSEGEATSEREKWHVWGYGQHDDAPDFLGSG